MKSTSLSRERGVTLIELLIVVTVIGILSAIAIPSYRRHIVKVNRADAKVGLTAAAQTLERCFTRYNAYNDARCVTGLPGNTEGDRYTISVDVPDAQPTTYTLTATAINGQASDTQCGNFTLNQLGTRGVVGATKTAAFCW